MTITAYQALIQSNTEKHLTFDEGIANLIETKKRIEIVQAKIGLVQAVVINNVQVTTENFLIQLTNPVNQSKLPKDICIIYDGNPPFNIGNYKSLFCTNYKLFELCQSIDWLINN